MTKRRWITFTLLVAALAAVLVFPGNWARIAGVVRGENFWRTRPTSYWRAEMQDWIQLQKTGWTPTFIEQWMMRFRIPVPNPQRALAPIWLMEDDPSSVPVLRDLARDADQEVSAHAVTALRVLREDGRAGLPELRGALNHPAPMTRLIAVEGVWDLTHEADQLIPVLVELLRDPDQNVRLRVQDNLQRIGPAAKVAVPAVVHALHNSEPADGGITVWHAYLVHTLMRLGREGQQAAQPYLLKLLRNGIQAGLEPSGAGSNSQLKDVLLQWAQSAALWLGEIGPAAAEAIPPLTEALSVPRLRPSAALALHRIDPNKQDALILGPLIETLRDTTVDAPRGEAAQVLGQMGDAAEPAVPALSQIITDKSIRSYFSGPTGASTLHLSAAEAVWRITHQADHVMPTILEEFRGPNDRRPNVYLRQPIVRLIEEMGPVAKAAVQDLIADLTYRDHPDLFPVGLTAWDIRENVRERIRTEDKYCAAVARALGAIGPDAKAAIPALLTALRDHSPAVRQAAAAALGKIDPNLNIDPATTTRFVNGAWWKGPIYILVAVLAIVLVAASSWFLLRCRRRSRAHVRASP
jgi:HEAT repeat protein